jgi:hypothetical protein
MEFSSKSRINLTVADMWHAISDTQQPDPKENPMFFFLPLLIVPDTSSNTQIWRVLASFALSIPRLDHIDVFRPLK